LGEGRAGAKNLAPCGTNRSREVRPLSWRRPQDAHRADPHRQDAMKAPTEREGREHSSPGGAPPTVHLRSGGSPATVRIVPHCPSILRTASQGSCHRPAPTGQSPNRVAEQEIARAAQDRRRWERCGTSPIMRDTLPGFRLRCEAGQIPRRPTSWNGAPPVTPRRSERPLRPCRHESPPYPRRAWRSHPQERRRPEWIVSSRPRKRPDPGFSNPPG